MPFFIASSPVHRRFQTCTSRPHALGSVSTRDPPVLSIRVLHFRMDRVAVAQLIYNVSAPLNSSQSHWQGSRLVGVPSVNPQPWRFTYNSLGLPHAPSFPVCLFLWVCVVCEKIDNPPVSRPQILVALFVWTNPDGARQLRRVAPRRRAPSCLLYLSFYLCCARCVFCVR